MINHFSFFYSLNTAPDDYTAIAQVLTFSAGQSAAQSVNIPVIDDILVEDSESFTVRATSSNNRVTINGVSSADVTATILDNDSEFYLPL